MDSEISQLEKGTPFRFADWPDSPIPRGSVGVYTIWSGMQFVYVGMSWKENTTKGLWGRMDSHASGRRSGDQFCVYVCDRFVIPALSASQLAAVGEGNLKLDELTRAYIAKHLEYRFVTTPDGRRAREIELRVRTLGLGGNLMPILNPR